MSAGGDAENLWQELVTKAAQKAGHEKYTSLFVLGDRESGKTTLLNGFDDRKQSKKLGHGGEAVRAPASPKHGGGGGDGGDELDTDYILEYSYINVKNRYDQTDRTEVRGRMNVWEMDANAENVTNLAPVFLSSNGLRNSAFVVALDLSKPWSLLERAEHWLGLIKEVRQEAWEKLDPSEQDELLLRESTFVQRFVDVAQKKREQEARAAAKAAKAAAAGDGADGSASDGDDADDMGVDDTSAPIDRTLPPGNLGVPLFIVGCKADLLPDALNTHVQREYDNCDLYEYITRCLRRLALEYGATLIFTSGKEVSDFARVPQEVIYHRLYGFPLEHPCKVIGSSDDYLFFSCSGYDSEVMITSVQPAHRVPDDKEFKDVFAAPDDGDSSAQDPSSAPLPPETMAPTNEDFFKRLQFTISSKGATPTSVRIQEPAKSPDGVKKTRFRQGSATEAATLSASKPRKARTTRAKSTMPAGASKEQVKDFFKQLVNNNEAAGKSRKALRKSLKKQG